MDGISGPKRYPLSVFRPEEQSVGTPPATGYHARGRSLEYEEIGPLLSSAVARF
jgi:hypothetical protein